ncbi:MAG: hypothetical protein ABI833_00020 [Acidobacteriota bacterium]
MSRHWLALFVCVVGGRAEMVDRISVVVDSQIIKHSDIFRDIRLTDFLNHETPSFAVAEQKKAVARLIDQALIRKELDAGLYSIPDPSEVDSLLQQLKNGFGSDAAYRRALATYDLSEADLRKQLNWQLTVLRFVSLRFGGGAPVPEPEVRAYYEQHLADFKKAGGSGGDFDTVRPQIEKALEGEGVNKLFFAWLDEAEKNAPIVYNEEALK